MVLDKPLATGRKEAEEDIRAGRVHNFPDTKKAVAFLHKQAGKKSTKSNGSVG